jgi:eight-cysteine-cluster-containing protein
MQNISNKTLIIISSVLVTIMLLVVSVSAYLYMNNNDNNIANDPTPNKCVATGCSGELCLSEKDAEIKGFSSCVWQEEFACYKLSSCEVQQNGQCGWTANEEFSQCLQNANNFDLFLPEE